jgi:co-chaperonin GroES (HSP10)
MQTPIGRTGESMYEDKVDLTKVKELLPMPAGYKLLIALPKVSDKEGSVYKPQDTVALEQTAAIVAFVVTKGKDAYADKTKFPNGPWCEEGDWITMRSYAGARLKINGTEFRLINDDAVDSVVPDPRAIKRAF